MWRTGPVVLLALAGCNQIFGLKQADLVDGALPFSCTAGSDCGAGEVCDTGSDRCVVCTIAEPGNCVGDTPLCGSDDACHGCGSDGDCPSGVCQPSGACVDPDSLSYVNANAGSGSDSPVDGCTLQTPCATLNFALSLASTKPTIRFTGSLNGSTTFDHGSFTIEGYGGAQLHASAGSPTVTVMDNANVILEDVDISGGTSGVQVDPAATGDIELLRCTIENNSDNGVTMQGTPVDTTALASVTIAQSRVDHNGNGGADIQKAHFHIIGNAFYANGSATSQVGGLNLFNLSDEPVDNDLAFNSFFGNTSAVVYAPGINCLAPVDAVDNIVAGNGSGSGAQVNLGANALCTFSYSVIHPANGAGSGSSIIDADPLFADPSSGDLTLGSGSPALCAADPTTPLDGLAAADPAGVSRVAPADIGAFVRGSGESCP